MSDKSISEIFCAELTRDGEPPTPVSKEELKEWLEKNNGLSETVAVAAVVDATTPAKDALSVALDGVDEDEPPKVPEGYNGGGSDEDKADGDGLIYITRTFTIDPAKYRSANYQPKDKYGKPIPVQNEAANPNEETAISDISLDKETVTDNGQTETIEEAKETTTYDERTFCYDEGKLYGEYEKGDVPVMDVRRAPTRETCETDITQCRAANPLFCRFHGPKLIEADIRKSLRLSGVAGSRVAVTRDTSSDNPRAFKVTVACRPDQRRQVEEAIDAFLREPGVNPTGERAYENGKLSNYYEMDLERVDRPPRANREPKAAVAARLNQTRPQGTIRGNGQEPRAAQPRRPRRPRIADFQTPQNEPQAPQQEQPQNPMSAEELLAFANQHEEPAAQPQQQSQNNIPTGEQIRDFARTVAERTHDPAYADEAMRRTLNALNGTSAPLGEGHDLVVPSGFFANNIMSDVEHTFTDEDQAAHRAVIDTLRAAQEEGYRPATRYEVNNEPAAQSQAPSPQQNAQPQEQQAQNRLGLRDAVYAFREIAETPMLNGLSEPQAVSLLRTLVSGQDWPQDPDAQHHFRFGNINMSRREAASRIIDALAGVADPDASVTNTRNALRRVVDLPRGEAQPPPAPAQNANANGGQADAPYPSQEELNNVIQNVSNVVGMPANSLRTYAERALNGNNEEWLRNVIGSMESAHIPEDNPVYRYATGRLTALRNGGNVSRGVPLSERPDSVRSPDQPISREEIEAIRRENEAFWAGKSLTAMKSQILDAISNVCSTKEVAAQDDALFMETMGIQRQDKPLEKPLEVQYSYEHWCNCWKAVATAILRLRGFNVKARRQDESSPVFQGTEAESGAQRLTFRVSQNAMSRNYERVQISDELIGELRQAQKEGEANFDYSTLYELTNEKVRPVVAQKMREILEGKENPDGTFTPPYPDGTLISSWDGGHCTLGLVYKGRLFSANPWDDSDVMDTTPISSITSGIKSTVDVVAIKNSVDWFRRKKSEDPRFHFNVEDEREAEAKVLVNAFLQMQRKLRRENPNVTDEEVYDAIPYDKEWQAIQGSYIIRPDQPLIKEMLGLARPQ